MVVRLKMLHQLIDELRVNTNKLEADILNEKGVDVIILQLDNLDNCISKFQGGLNQIREQHLAKEKQV